MSAVASCPYCGAPIEAVAQEAPAQTLSGQMTVDDCIAEAKGDG